MTQLKRIIKAKKGTSTPEISRKEARERSYITRDYNREGEGRANFDIAYQNAYNALYKSGLRGRDLVMAARNMVAGTLPETGLASQDQALLEQVMQSQADANSGNANSGNTSGNSNSSASSKKNINLYDVANNKTYKKHVSDSQKVNLPRYVHSANGDVTYSAPEGAAMSPEMEAYLNPEGWTVVNSYDEAFGDARKKKQNKNFVYIQPNGKLMISGTKLKSEVAPPLPAGDPVTITDEAIPLPEDVERNLNLKDIAPTPLPTPGAPKTSTAPTSPTDSTSRAAVMDSLKRNTPVPPAMRADSTATSRTVPTDSTATARRDSASVPSAVRDSVAVPAAVRDSATTTVPPVVPPVRDSSATSVPVPPAVSDTTSTATAPADTSFNGTLPLDEVLAFYNGYTSPYTPEDAKRDSTLAFRVAASNPLTASDAVIGQDSTGVYTGYPYDALDDYSWDSNIYRSPDDIYSHLKTLKDLQALRGWSLPIGPYGDDSTKYYGNVPDIFLPGIDWEEAQNRRIEDAILAGKTFSADDWISSSKIKDNNILTDFLNNEGLDWVRHPTNAVSTAMAKEWFKSHPEIYWAYKRYLEIPIEVREANARGKKVEESNRGRYTPSASLGNNLYVSSGGGYYTNDNPVYKSGGILKRTK